MRVERNLLYIPYRVGRVPTPSERGDYVGAVFVPPRAIMGINRICPPRSLIGRIRYDDCADFLRVRRFAPAADVLDVVDVEAGAACKADDLSTFPASTKGA